MRQDPRTSLARRLGGRPRNTCCQRWDGWLKTRYASLEIAQAAADARGLRAYECRVQPGTYHLTSKPVRGAGK